MKFQDYRDVTMNVVVKAVKAALLSVQVLAQVLFSVSVCAETLAPPPGEATIVRRTDGTARVIFQPRADLKSEVEAYQGDGGKIGRVTWQALFEVEVKQTALEASMTPQGIDLEKLLKDVGALTSLPNGRKMIRTEVPYSVQDSQSREIIATGKEAYFPIEAFVEKRTVTPVGARASREDDTEGQAVAGRFNDVLAERGVVEPKSAPSSSSRPTKKVTEPHSSAIGTDSGGRVPKFANYADELRFLSPPTCSCEKGGRQCLYWSGFGYRKAFKANHAGIDISAGQGTPVMAAAPGCVKRQTVGNGGGWGNSVMLDHGQGIETHYAHMSKFAPNMKPGQCFKRGDLIGYSGQTGRCTGPHLHFGVYVNGSPSDPHKYLLARSNADLNQSCSALAQYNSSIEKEQSLALQLAQDRASGNLGRFNSSAAEKRVASTRQTDSQSAVPSAPKQTAE